MSRRFSLKLVTGFLALGAVTAACRSGPDTDLMPPLSGSGGAFGVGKAAGGSAFGGTGFVSASGGGSAIPTACGVGPIDVGRIGGPGRDATAHHWTVPFETGQAARLAQDPDGNLLVILRFADVSVGAEHHLSVDGDDLLLAKLDAAGKPSWSKHLVDTGSSEVSGLATDAQGNIYVAGGFQGSISFGGLDLRSATGPSGSGADAFLAKLDADGEHLWSKSFGDANHQAVLGLVTNGAGNPIIAGSFGGIVSFGGDEFLSQLGSFGHDLFVAELDGNGDHVKSAAFGTSADELVSDVALDPAENLLLLGWTGSSDGVLSPRGLIFQKLDPSLDPVFELEYPSPGLMPRGVAADSQGDIVLSGLALGELELEAGVTVPPGMFAVKLDPTGAMIWNKSFGDAETAPALDIDPDGRILLSGGFRTADFGGGPLVSAGFLDVFLAKLEPNGDHVWSQRAGSCGPDFGTDVLSGRDGNIYLSGSFLAAIDFGGSAIRLSNQAAFLARLAP